MSRYIVSATDKIHFATGQRVVTPIHKSNDSTTQLVQGTLLSLSTREYIGGSVRIHHLARQTKPRYPNEIIERRHDPFGSYDS